MGTKWTIEEKHDWNRMYYRSLDMSMHIYLAELPEARMPVLELMEDEGAWTNNQIIHIGTGNLSIHDEKEMMMWATFLLGHEIQHVLSTTDKAWNYGLDMGFKKICQRFSLKAEGRQRRFVKDSDYERFLSDMAAKGYHISTNSLKHFVHFIINSLEDGRIERIRCIYNPGYINYIKYCRGKSWEDEPIPPEMKKDISDPRTYLSIVLNQVLTLSTMSIYQKGFAEIAAGDKNIHRIISNLNPHIKKAVCAVTCRECMDEAIQICEILADEIIEACKYTPIEELLKLLIQNILHEESFIADTRTEVHGGDGMQIEIFGVSDLSGEKTSSTGNSGNNDSNTCESNQNVNTSKSGNSSNSSSQSDQGNSTSESGDGDKISDIIKDAMNEAVKGCKEEVDTSLIAGRIPKKDIPKQDISITKEDALPDMSSVEKEYGNNITFREEKRNYKPNIQMPVELQSRAKTLKRKLEKIFKSKEFPSLRGQKKGKIDAAKIYKLAMDQTDFFKKNQQSEVFDGCCQLLMDNSGSMGKGRYSKRYYCCCAAAVIENAFSDFMPLKISAFTSYGNNNVSHALIKNWHEKVHANATWNFFKHMNCQSGNKDGFSIRIATKDILSQTEKNKLMIIISDGLPSDYSGGFKTGHEDVKNAVKEARKSGIKVIGILIGTDIHEKESKKFIEMYGTNSIITEPEQIEAVLVKELKRFCFH